ncbi:MAG: 23S rRNA (guanosine(2251)-2'-O)-methyltransferase RlmB [Alphaproteobacteria bacterium]|nr:MAG: 23S rRNA (guanosine(2251)-2'-O)-methyltransferase RlmB [Alphaproteobacteria bacterium]
MRPPRPPRQGSRQRRVGGAREAREPSRETAPARAGRGHGVGSNWVYGRHAVAAALANPARRWRRLAVLAGQEDEAAALAARAAAERRGEAEAVQVIDRAVFDRLLPEGAVHQGWALEVEPLDSADLEDVLRAAEVTPGRSIVIVLDQVSDPHNVGAILRSAAAFGASAVIVGEHGAPPATGALAKAASGALDAVPLVRAVNLARTLDRLKEAGFWCCGLDEAASAPLAGLDLGNRVVLVLGSEGGGLRRLLRERCDYLARLPTRPALPSLNVSNAAAVALYELVRGEPGA